MASKNGVNRFISNPQPAVNLSENAPLHLTKPEKFPLGFSIPAGEGARTTMTRFVLTLAALAALTFPASAASRKANLGDWLPNLPVPNADSPAKRAERIREWLPAVKPEMSVGQVLVFLGAPDWGTNKKGEYQWWLPPNRGVFRYSYSRNGRSPGDDTVTLIHFDSNARVTRIETNGKLIAVAPPSYFHRPLPRGVFWRR